MRRDAIGPCNNVSRPANRASPPLRIVDLMRSILETDSLSANADGETEPAGTGARSPYSPSGIVDSFTGSGIQRCREPCSVVIVAACRQSATGPARRFVLLGYDGIRSNRCNGLPAFLHRFDLEPDGIQRRQKHEGEHRSAEGSTDQR